MTLKHVFFSVPPVVKTKALVGAVEDRSVTLYCEATGYPKAMVEWMRYGNCTLMLY